MHIGQALDLVSRYDSLRNPLTSLGDYLNPELISRCLVTLRKRRLPLEMMVWCIVGMALQRKSLPSADVNDGRHALPRWRNGRPVQSSLGNRTGIQRDKTDNVAEQADAEK